ncbi:MAG: hypothetical protein C0592_00875 [Marinilabiliales bacterium]|nr:MAG: hypothetical protein C0592_00875 [Marinilabiliales bacterium]
MLGIIEKYLNIIQFFINIKIMKKKLKRYQHLLKGKLIDIGAGEAPYKSIFTACNSYTTTNTKRHYIQEGLADVENSTDIWIEDGTAIPVDNESFDSVICLQVLSVIKDPEAFFNEVYRILHKEGVFLLTTDFLYPKWSKEDVMRHTDTHLRNLAEKSGLEIIAIESFGGFWTMLHSNINRYIRSYPKEIKKSKTYLQAFFRVLFFLISLIILPFFQIYGWFIYLFEKNKTNEFQYSMNTILVAKKTS